MPSNQNNFSSPFATQRPTPPKTQELTITQTYLQQLSAATKTLNELSDELTQQVAEIETRLNTLNLGVSTNVRVESWADEDGIEWESWRLAYDKRGGKWGFVI